MICYTKPGDDPTNRKIALPCKLIKPTVRWYHQVTGHPGGKRLNDQKVINAIIETYEDTTTTSIVNIFKKTNSMEKDMDSH